MNADCPCGGTGTLLDIKDGSVVGSKPCECPIGNPAYYAASCDDTDDYKEGSLFTTKETHDDEDHES